MEVSSIPVLLITANVGSVFEDPSRLLNSWIKEFLNKIALVKPHFLALHLQEVGGKTYEKSMEYVQEFIRILCESDELSDYNRIRVYLDEDYNSAEHFTALGNLYFVHHSLQTVKIWNFSTHDWESADGKNIYTGNIEAVATKEKAKFPQHFFPECKWSRKGFLRTRWELNCTVIDLVNIHLFHDASNLAACEEFPSVYCKTRRRALVHTLERFHRDNKNGIAPYFVFGDFNFRCDTEGVVKKLTEDLTKHRIQNAKNDSTKMHYKNSEGENVLIVGKKEFTHNEHQTKFKESWLQKFDRELEPLRELLVEYPITFAPTYPYEEDPEMPKYYMSTRCPAWCDRILLNPTARELIVDETFSMSDYNIIGENICMGDHKPIYLNINLKTLQEENKNEETLHLQGEDKNRLKQPRISINVTNIDEGTVDDLCMCSLYLTDNDNFQHDDIIINSDNSIENIKSNQMIENKPKICSQCQNIIKFQANEPHRTLISKRLMLSNNIIVNRIDTQLLNTTNLMQQFEPYTPESAESHSPCPEYAEYSMDDDDIEVIDNDNVNNINKNDLISRNSQNQSQNINNINLRQNQPNNNNIQIILNDCKTNENLIQENLKKLTTENKNILQKQDSLNNKTLIKLPTTVSSTTITTSAAGAATAVPVAEKRGIVSPIQLKSRLEILQRKSLENGGDIDDNNIGVLKTNKLNSNINNENLKDIIDNEKTKENSCFNRCCAIS